MDTKINLQKAAIALSKKEGKLANPATTRGREEGDSHP